MKTSVDKHFLYLGPEAPHEVTWAEIPAYGGLSTGRGSLAEASHLEGRKIIVFVPGTEILLSEANVPRSRRQIMLQSIPFALEENLCDDVDQLHFAIGPVSEKRIAPVAVVDKDRMAEWLAMLDEAGLKAKRIIPSSLALPITDGRETLVLNGNEFLWRKNTWAGFGGETGNLAFFLNSEPEEKLPVRIFAAADQPDLAGIIPPSTEILEQREYSELIEILAEGYQGREAIDLLQGEFSPGAEWKEFWHKWRLPITATVLICLMGITGFFLDYFRLKSANRTLDRQIKTIYLQTFPESRKVDFPRHQMEQKLKDLRKDSGGTSSFLSTYDQTVPLLTGAPGFNLNSIRFKNDHFEFEMEIRDLQSLDKLKNDLAKVPGVDVVIKNAETKGDRVKARLQISTGGDA